MKKNVKYSLWLASAAGFALCAGALWADEHPMGGMEHPSDPAVAHESAAPSASGANTLTGEVVDLSCFMAEGASGKEHQKCGKMCLMGGGPAGLLMSDGSVVVLVENHKKAKAYKMLKEYADEHVKVTGTTFNKGGVKALAVDSVEKSK